MLPSCAGELGGPTVGVDKNKKKLSAGCGGGGRVGGRGVMNLFL